jgi:hypothetical protein
VMTDKLFFELLSTYRFLEMKQAIAAFHRGSRKSCYDLWKKHENLRHIHYFHPKSPDSRIPTVSFCVLSKEGAKAYSLLEDRAWPFEAALDVHIATSVFCMATLKPGNGKAIAMRVEPTEIDKVYGTTVEPNVPWCILPHFDRKACVFRVQVGNKPAEVTRTLKKMWKDERIASLMETGEFGLLVLTPSQNSRDKMHDSIKLHYKTTRIHLGIGPTAATLASYLRKK